MILYHTSSVKVPKPDTLHSRNALDFGKGFYLTHLRDQAEKYGEKFTDRGMPAYCIRTEEMSRQCITYKESIQL